MSHRREQERGDRPLKDRFAPMRLSEREVPAGEAEGILASGEYGVLSVSGDGGYPYGVPVNYAYSDGIIYIHHTNAGSLLTDMLSSGDKVCFTVVSRSEVLPEMFTDAYESVIVFGTAAVSEDIEGPLRSIGKKYSPGLGERMEEHIRGAAGRCLIIAVKVEHLTGKRRPRTAPEKTGEVPRKGF